MKAIKTIILAFIISTSVQANIFDDAEKWSTVSIHKMESFL
jgi:hypothetical protein